MNKGKLTLIILAVLLLAVTCIAQESWSQTMIYAKFDGIDGPVTDQGFEKTVKVLGFGHNASVPNITTGGGPIAGKADLRPIKILKALDKTTPKLYEHLTKIEMIPSIEIMFVRSPGSSGPSEPVIYFTITLTRVYLSGITPSINSADETIAELVNLVYERIKWSYKDEQGQTVEYGWNVETDSQI